MEREALKLAVDGLEKILHTFAKDGKVVMASMIRNELFAEVNSLLQQAKAALAQPAQEPVARVLQIIKELRPAIKPMEGMGKGKTTTEWFDILVKEIERIRPAQEPYDQTALELCNVCGWKTLIPDDGCLNCERAQPAQEPVALVIDGFLIKSELPKEYTGHLYTTPPKREWVGLTDEELLHIGVATGLERAAAEMISNKLKGKNT